jgi:hypothetical protein
MDCAREAAETAGCWQGCGGGAGCCARGEAAERHASRRAHAGALRVLLGLIEVFLGRKNVRAKVSAGRKCRPVGEGHGATDVSGADPAP